MIRTTLVALAALALCACQPAPTHHDAMAFASQAESGFYLTGSLATLGSFEWDVAPLENHAAVALHNTAVALKSGRLSVDAAQSRMDAIDRAHDLLVRAKASCAQDGHTAKCTKDEPGARALLDQARNALASIP